jgi:EF hand domain-containing protein
MANRKLLLAAVFVLSAGPVLAFGGRPSPEEFQADVAAAFAQADADNSGGLSRAEFQTFKQLMKAKMEERMFNRADADGNGEVTLSELQAAHRPHGHCGPPPAQ